MADHFKEVPNTANMFPNTPADSNTYEINNICKTFWKKYGPDDSIEWYNEGYVTGTHCAEGSSGGELLVQLIHIINTIVVKHLRDHDRPVDSNIKELRKLLIISAELLISNSIDTVSANEGVLDKEDIISFLHGFINSQFEKVRTQYVD